MEKRETERGFKAKGKISGANSLTGGHEWILTVKRSSVMGDRLTDLTFHIARVKG